jgi:RNA polymerase sigma-70 factor (ECF subfamily)
MSEPLPKPAAERTPQAEESDESLMRRYCKGDRRAFDELFARHAARVHAFLVRHLRDRARADDVLQATWLNVHRARATFTDGERFAPWLFTIANNARRDEGRRIARDHADLTREGTLPEPPPAPARSPEAEAVQAALASIPESYREVIVLHRWHDLGFDEIARVLGTTEGAVKLRAHRGYQALRTALGKESS